MEGNSTITCLKNEHWSHAPDCIEVTIGTNNQNKLKTLEIVLPTVFIVLLTIIYMSHFAYACKTEGKMEFPT